jgi:hypothetical protein
MCLICSFIAAAFDFAAVIIRITDPGRDDVFQGIIGVIILVPRRRETPFDKGIGTVTIFGAERLISLQFFETILICLTGKGCIAVVE